MVHENILKTVLNTSESFLNAGSTPICNDYESATLVFLHVLYFVVYSPTRGGDVGAYTGSTVFMFYC
jgi:hypothetical protein